MTFSSCTHIGKAVFLLEKPGRGEKIATGELLMNVGNWQNRLQLQTGSANLHFSIFHQFLRDRFIEGQVTTSTDPCCVNCIKTGKKKLFFR